jgi:hypothetical protein
MKVDNMNNSCKNAILGIAFNYTDLHLFPFLKSLEETGYKGELILFTNNKTSLASILEYDCNIRYINVEKELSFIGPIHRTFGWIARSLHLQHWWVGLHSRKIRSTLRKNQPLSKWLLGLFHHNFCLTAARFTYYYNWLIANDCRQCFFTDVTDVIFQGDIFQQADAQKVMVFEENASVMLGNEKNNKLWVEASFGVDRLNSIRNSVIFCAGTILCSRQQGLDFLNDFITEIIRDKKPLDLNGFDQGILNYMVSHDRKEYFDASRNGEIVLTVATEAENDIGITEGAIFLKNRKKAPAVVHQYNRYRKLIQFIQEKYIS